MQRRSHYRAALAVSLGSALWLACCSPALALYQDKVLVRGFTGLTYDSNVFRIANELDPARLGLDTRSDNIWNYGVGLKLNLPVSRQLFTGDFSVSQSKYQSNEILDFTGYNLRGGWNWTAGNDWNGAVSLGASQSRTSYFFGSVGFFVPRLVRNYDASATARYALTPRWELQTGLSWWSYVFTDDAFRFADFHAWSADFGGVYKSAPGNSTGVRLTYSEGRYPNRTPDTTALFDNAYRQLTLAALVDWQITGSSRLHGDAGVTTRQHDLVPARNFTAPTGTLIYDWMLSGKTSLKGTLFSDVRVYETLAATYVRRTGVVFGGSYRASGLTTVQIDVSARKEDQLGDSAIPGVAQRRDWVYPAGVSVVYQYSRTVSLSGEARYESRTSNVPLADFNRYTLGVSVQVQF